MMCAHGKVKKSAAAVAARRRRFRSQGQDEMESFPLLLPSLLVVVRMDAQVRALRAHATCGIYVAQDGRVA